MSRYISTQIQRYVLLLTITALVVCASIRILWTLADLLLISFGMCLVWSSPVIPQLQSYDTDVNPLGTPITTLEISMITTIPFAAGILGSIISTKSIDTFGRKRSNMIISITMLCSLVTTAVATHIYIYFVGLFVTGLSMNGSILSVAIYNSEISEDNNRGKLGAIASLSVPFGCLLAYILGPITSVRTFTLLCGLPALLSLLLSPLIPESPIFLITNKPVSEGFKALEKLRGTKDVKVLELEYKKIQETTKATTTAKGRSYIDLVRNPSVRKSLLLGLQVYTAAQFSGIFAILSYAAPIFNEAGSTLSGNNIAILIGLVNILIYVVSIPCIDRLGRRTLILFSSFFCIFPMFFLGLYFYLKHIEPSFLDNIRWVCILFVIFYIIFYGVGLGPVPISFVSEIFPEDLRAKGIGTVFIWDNCCCVVILFGLPLISEAYGIHYCLWTHSLLSLLSFVSIYFTMPETKGKSFLEIQTCLQKTRENPYPNKCLLIICKN